MKPSKRILFGISLLVSLLTQPANLYACSACYGAPDSGMAKGLVWGIVALLGVVLSVLAGIVTFFVHVGRRSNSTFDASTSVSSSEPIPKT